MPGKILSRCTGVGAATLLALTVSLGVPRAVDAFSLGQIRVSSPLGAPFLAEIPLTMSAEEENLDLEVAIGAPNEYRVMELDRPLTVGDLTVQVKGAKGEKRRIVVQGSAPVREPFFNLLLKSVLGRGSHFRVYPVFLDLAPAKAAEVATATPARPAPVAVAAARPADATLAGATHYGPVKSGETLTEVARQVVAAKGGSLQSVMVAIWSANKKKFVDENMHGLPVGVVLDLPAAQEMQSFSDTQARAMMKEQREAWLHRSAPVKAVAEKPESAPVAVTPSAVVPSDSSPPVAKAGKPAPSPSPVATQRSEYDLRLTVESGAKDGAVKDVQEIKAQAGVPASGEAAAVASESGSGIAIQLAEKLEQLKTETARLAELNEKLLQTEAERDKLKQKLAAMTKRVEALEQEKVALQQAGVDWSVIGAGAGGSGLLVGTLLWLLRRRKREPVVNEEKRPFELHEESGAGKAAGVSGLTPVARTPSLDKGRSNRVVEAAPPVALAEEEYADGVELAGPVHMDSFAMAGGHEPDDRLNGQVASPLSAGSRSIDEQGDEAHSAPVETLEIGDDADDLSSLGGLEIGGEPDGPGDVRPFETLEIGGDGDDLPSLGGLEIGGESDGLGDVRPFETLEIGDDGDDLPSLGGLEIGDDLDEASEPPAVAAKPGVGRPQPVELDDLEVIAFSQELDGVSKPEKGSAGAVVTPVAAVGPVEELEVLEFDLDLTSTGLPKVTQPMATVESGTPSVVHPPGVVELEEKDWADGELILELSEEVEEPGRKG